MSSNTQCPFEGAEDTWTPMGESQEMTQNSPRFEEQYSYYGNPAHHVPNARPVVSYNDLGSFQGSSSWEVQSSFPTHDLGVNSFTNASATNDNMSWYGNNARAFNDNVLRNNPYNTNNKLGFNENVHRDQLHHPYYGTYPQVPLQNSLLTQGFDDGLPMAGQSELPLERQEFGANAAPDEEDAEAADDPYPEWLAFDTNEAAGTNKGNRRPPVGREADNLDIDNGEFVVENLAGKVNIEKRGVTRKNNGLLEWQDPKDNAWHRAVIHHNIRAQLIREAEARHPGQSYNHPDPEGSGPHDVTSFHISYKTWGEARGDRPQILFQFDPPEHRSRLKPGFMKWHNMVVLNHQNNPISDWPIPATLSSKTSGSHMEAWKRLYGISQEEMRSRMPRYTLEMLDGVRTRVSLPDKNGVVNMPMQRFRDRAACITWAKRKGSDNLRINILSLMRSEGFDPLVSNSTEGFGRDLSYEEQQAVKKDNKGKRPKKAPLQQPKPKAKGTKREAEEDEDASRHTATKSYKRTRAGKRQDQWSDEQTISPPLEEPEGVTPAYLEHPLSENILWPRRTVEGQPLSRSMRSHDAHRPENRRPAPRSPALEPSHSHHLTRGSRSLGQRRKREEVEDNAEEQDYENPEPPRKRRYGQARPSLPIAAYRKDQRGQGEHSSAQAHDVDCRQIVPATESQRRSLDEALEATREAFFEYVGFQAPATDRQASYLTQWGHIRRSFEGFDWSDFPKGEIPYIPQLPPWYTTIEQWPPHVKDSMFYEAWIYGHRAPRLGDKLIKMPGQFMLAISKMSPRQRQVTLKRKLREHGYLPEDEGEEEDIL